MSERSQRSLSRTHVTLPSTLGLGHRGLDFLVLLATHTIDLILASSFCFKQLSCMSRFCFKAHFLGFIDFSSSCIVGCLA